MFVYPLLLVASVVGCGSRVREGVLVGDCTDRADNDADGLYDCNDDGCAGSPDCSDAGLDSEAEPSDSDAGTGDADPDSGDLPLFSIGSVFQDGWALVFEAPVGVVAVPVEVLEVDGRTSHANVGVQTTARPLSDGRWEILLDELGASPCDPRSWPSIIDVGGNVVGTSVGRHLYQSENYIGVNAADGAALDAGAAVVDCSPTSRGVIFVRSAAVAGIERYAVGLVWNAATIDAEATGDWRRHDQLGNPEEEWSESYSLSSVGADGVLRVVVPDRHLLQLHEVAGVGGHGFWLERGRE